jgi:hypothetical protein
VAVTLGGVAGSGAACAPELGPTGSEQGSALSTHCAVFGVPQDRPLSDDELARLGDPIANRILRTTCPQELSGVLRVLRAAPDCADSQITSRVVSERSQLLGRPDVYRAVLTQDCAGGTDHDLFVSIFGVDPGAGKLPEKGVEVIGRTTSGVFNFYVNDGGWRFMGSSMDAVAAGYDCDRAHGDCMPKSAKRARCWACHESGGITMKELDSPWQSWSGLAHSDAVFDAYAELGHEQNAFNMQSRTEAANGRWATDRVEILAPLGVAELLRPLFCTLTVNLHASGRAGWVGFVPGEFFVETQLRNEVISFVTPIGQAIGFTGGLVRLDPDAYRRAIVDNRQRIVDRFGTQLVQADGAPIVEPPNGLVFPTKGDIDRRYVAELVARGLVDQDFVLDVLHVDFTRPIFSPDRCALLDAAPTLGPDAITPAAIKAGFLRNLASLTKSGPYAASASRLVGNLQTPNDAPRHHTDVRGFIDRCNARDRGELARDILRYNAHLKARTKAHRAETPQGAQGIIEFAETLPIDELPDTPVAFDEASCTLAPR